MPDIHDLIKELASIEIEYTDSDDNYCCLKSHIKSIDKDCILVAPPQKDNQTVHIPDGRDINVNFKTENGILSAEAKVISKQSDNISDLKISFPTTGKLIERREFLRVPLNLKTNILKFPDSTGLNPETIEIQTRNISGSGLCYISEKPLENYHDIHCQIFLEKKEKPLYAKCDYLYSKKVKINNEKAYLTALSFSGISEENVAKLVKACFKYQINSRNR